jgi:integrase
MASIAKRPDGRWRARYRDAAGREHSKHFDRKIDAQRWLDQVTAAVVTGQYVDPALGRVTFKQYATAWADAQPWRPKTVQRVKSALTTHINPTFGDRPIASIRTSEVQSLVRTWSTTLAPYSVKMIYTTLRSVFKAAETDRVIARSPCVRIVLPSMSRRHLVIPEVATLRAIGEALPEDLTIVPLIAAGLGLRPGEVYGLAVEHIDFLRRSVAVTQQLDGARKTAPLKTAASYRTVPLPRVVGEALSDHIARTGRTSGLLFLETDGRPVRLSEANAAWRHACTKAKSEGLRLHDCRHAYASALIAAGESVKTIQARLGHASAMVTLDVYGHLWPDSEEQTRVAVDRWLDAPADCVRTQIVSAQVSGA